MKDTPLYTSHSNLTELYANANKQIIDLYGKARRKLYRGRVT